MNPTKRLTRDLGLLGLVATGVCSMMGAAINVIPIMIQRNVPGIGPYVLPAYVLGAVPAVLAALAYASLASGMPRAGGSYIYASRALHPYWGFVASFSQWFGLCIAIGVVSYVLIPFLRDIATTVGFPGVAATLDTPSVRLVLALTFLWVFVAINIRGLRLYTRTLVPLMFLMFVGGGVVIVAGFLFEQSDFIAALGAGSAAITGVTPAFNVTGFLAASAILFSSFIGFDSIAQAGGEARDPNRTLPLAIGIAMVTVGSFYLLFTHAVYRVVPWEYMAQRAMTEDLTAPGLFGYVLSPGWTVAIIAGAAIALINDLPAMLLAVSRLMFAWSDDRIFPPVVAQVHPTFRTPYVALLASGVMASLGVLGSHFAGDFFLGVDILVTALLVNFLLMCVSLLALPIRNPALAAEIRFVTNRRIQQLIGILGTIFLTTFLVVHIAKDLRADVALWHHSTYAWLFVMVVATVIFSVQWKRLSQSGEGVVGRFATLPDE